MRRNLQIVCALLIVFVLGMACMPTFGWADDASVEDEVQIMADEDTGDDPAADEAADPAESDAVEDADEAAMEDEDVVAEAPAAAEEKPADKSAQPVAAPAPAAMIGAEADSTEVSTSDSADVTDDAEEISTDDAEEISTDDVRLDAEATSNYPVSQFFRDSTITKPTVAYHAHMQTYGWGVYRMNGQKSGQGGKRLEGIEIGVKVPGIRGGIRYMVYIPKYGWNQGWRSNGQMAGTAGKGKQIDALRIELTGDLAKKYNVWYRSYVRGRGWGSWVLNGRTSGLPGRSKRVECVQIRVMAKGTTMVRRLEGSAVNYNVRMQTFGWMASVADGVKAGLASKGMRMEAINIRLGKRIDGGIRYRSHVQGNGWEKTWRVDGETSGTVGEAKRIEAIRIELTGNAKDVYNVWYRVYAQSQGWLGWTWNGNVAGKPGKSMQIEAIQVKIVRKGKPGPSGLILPEVTDSLIYLDAGHGPSGFAGYDTGATGSGYYEADENAELVNLVTEYATNIYGLNIYNNVGCDRHYTERQAHAKSVGATSFVSIHFNWASSGATGTESFIYRTYGGYTGLAVEGSSTMQKIMHRRVVGALGLFDRGMKSEAFSVLNGRKTGIPATLVEICFISNAGDMERYKEREDKVARAIAAGLYEIYAAGY